MPRKKNLSQLHLGECFVADSDDDEPVDQVGSIIPPARAFLVQSVDDAVVVARSASGQERSFSPKLLVASIPRGGFERLVVLHQKALDALEET